MALSIEQRRVSSSAVAGGLAGLCLLGPSLGADTVSAAGQYELPVAPDEGQPAVLIFAGRSVYRAPFAAISKAGLSSWFIASHVEPEAALDAIGSANKKAGAGASAEIAKIITAHFSEPRFGADIYRTRSGELAIEFPERDGRPACFLGESALYCVYREDDVLRTATIDRDLTDARVIGLIEQILANQRA